MALGIVFEWKIENFSSWCEAVHGKCIKSPDIFRFGIFSSVELYPRGCSGQEDHMKVHFCDVESDSIGGFAFVCSYGSSNRSQQLEITRKGERVPGPSVDLRFEEVRDQLRNADQKDEVILRFCIQCVKGYEKRMCTTIGVRKLAFKIYPKLNRMKFNESKEISYFRYSSMKGQGIRLKIARQDERIQLILEPNAIKEEKAVLVESTLNVLGSDNGVVRKEGVQHVFTNLEKWTLSESLTVNEFEEKGITILLMLKVINGEIFEKYNYYIKDNFVNIDITGCTTSKDKSSESRVTSNQSGDSATELSKDLMCLYQDQDFSDFQLKCGDVTFPVHKNMLSARSPIFKTMLSTDMTEAASGQVVIEDLDPSTLCLFLTYLYTGVVEDMQSDRALKLYYAADKYQVPALKRECGHFLRANLSVSNVCDVLSLADKHKDDDLITVSHDFILNNYGEVLGSEEWAGFMEIEPLLAVKTVTHFAQKKYVEKSVNLP